MMRAKRNWVRIAASAAAGIMIVLSVTAASAAPLAISEGATRPAVPNAAALLRFYPAPLASTPSGVIEDQQVWLAKVQGLMASAPSLLQQSLLSSQSKQEFSANVTLLQQLQEGILKQSTSELEVAAKSARVATKALGDSSNVVYKPLTSCRIMDSRNASFASGVQGPLTGNTLYHIPGFITDGTNWGTYGGSGSSDCGLDSTYGGTIWAVALVITILDPNFDAFLGVSSTNSLSTTLSTVALNYTHGQGLSTMYIVPQFANTIYFAMPAGLSANIVFDVVGFFHISDATALDCTTATSTASFLGAVTATCAAGYTLAGGGCRSSSIFDHTYQIYPSSTTDWSCGFWPESGQSLGATLTAYARCCRVPGR